MPLFLQSPPHHTSLPPPSKSLQSPTLPSPPRFQSASKSPNMMTTEVTEQSRKQSNIIILDDPDESEVYVAEILTQLLDLIPAYDFCKPSFHWGAKRRRSAISQTNQFSTPHHPLPPSSTTAKVAAHGGEAILVAKTTGKSNKAASPATPLMFSPSESDDKARTPSRVSVSKRKLLNKEELTQSLTDLTNQKASLVKEMEAVKRHLDNLKASNMELKNRKQVIIYGLNQPMFQNLHSPHHHHLNHYHHQNHQNLPQNQNQNQQQQQGGFQLQQYPPTSSIQWPSFVTPSATPPPPPTNPVSNGSVSVLPDLNLSFEDTGHVEAWQPSDAMAAAMVEYNNVNVNNKAVASARARKRRMQIYKEKNQNLRQR